MTRKPLPPGTCPHCGHTDDQHYVGCPRGRCSRCKRARAALDGLCMPCHAAVETLAEKPF